MSMTKKMLSCLLAAIGASTVLSAAVVVRTVNPTWEVVVADDVMDPPAGGVPRETDR